MIVLSIMEAQMFGRITARANRQLENRVRALEKQMRVALDTIAAQQELIMTQNKSINLQKDMTVNAVKDALRADAIGLITMTTLAAVMAHVAAGLKPHPEAKRQLDLFLGMADKVVDGLAAEIPKAAGGFQSQALRDLRGYASALLPKGPSPH